MLNIKAIRALRLLSRHDSVAAFYSIWDRAAYDKLGSLFQSNPRDAYPLITISPKYNCVYIGVPKVASSSIKYTLWLMETDGSQAQMKKVKRSSNPFNHHKKLDYYLYSDDLYRFTVVRNPYERVLSCYFDKILSELRTQFLGLGLKNYLRDRPLEFLEFLSLIHKQSPEKMDIHWRPQADIVQQNKINYDLIGRFETIGADMVTVLTQINADEKFIAPWRQPANTRTGKKLAKYIGREERDLIREIYAKDFSQFGYSTELAHLDSNMLGVDLSTSPDKPD